MCRLITAVWRVSLFISARQPKKKSLKIFLLLGQQSRQYEYKSWKPYGFCVPHERDGHWLNTYKNCFFGGAWSMSSISAYSSSRIYQLAAFVNSKFSQAFLWLATWKFGAALSSNWTFAAHMNRGEKGWKWQYCGGRGAPLWMPLMTWRLWNRHGWLYYLGMYFDSSWNTCLYHLEARVRIKNLDLQAFTVFSHVPWSIKSLQQRFKLFFSEP